MCIYFVKNCYAFVDFHVRMNASDHQLVAWSDAIFESVTPSCKCICISKISDLSITITLIRYCTIISRFHTNTFAWIFTISIINFIQIEFISGYRIIQGIISRLWATQKNQKWLFIVNQRKVSSLKYHTKDQELNKTRDISNTWNSTST